MAWNIIDAIIAYGLGFCAIRFAPRIASWSIQEAPKIYKKVLGIDENVTLKLWGPFASPVFLAWWIRSIGIVLCVLSLINVFYEVILGKLGPFIF